MATIYDVDGTELIEELAKELQKVESIKAPPWAAFVKTGVNKERPPARDDWWHIRAASILRKVALKGPIGVSKLRALYGGKQSRGYGSERYRKGSGNIARKIIQQLEKAELLKQAEKGAHKGRVITSKGIKLIDNIANRLSKSKPKAEEAAIKVEEKKEDKAKPAEKKPAEEKKAEAENKEATAKQ